MFAMFGAEVKKFILMPYNKLLSYLTRIFSHSYTYHTLMRKTEDTKEAAQSGV